LDVSPGLFTLGLKWAYPFFYNNYFQFILLNQRWFLISSDLFFKQPYRWDKSDTSKCFTIDLASLN
jgi:hypothetical protein